MANLFLEVAINSFALRAKLSSRSVFTIEELFFSGRLLFWRGFFARDNTLIVHGFGRGTMVIASHGQYASVEE
jgi:hypothetical protein